MREKKRNKNIVYSIPFFIAVFLIVIVPITYTLYISFFNMNIYHWDNYRFIGFENYKKALLIVDSGFIPALLRTILWTILSVGLQLLISFFVALGLNVEGLKLKGIYKTLIIIPWAVPAYVSILIWRMGMFNTEFGYLNSILKSIGLSPINFLATNKIAFISCLVVNLWLSLPYMITMIDGALQSIDRSFYESARLEGASFFQRHKNITIPMIKPIMMPVVIMTTFMAFKQFDIVYLMTLQTGAHTGADINTIITYVYEKSFVTSNYGYSSAASVIVFIITIFLYFVSKKMGEKRV